MSADTQTTCTAAELLSTLRAHNLGTFSFPYVTIKQPLVKMLRPFAKAGLITIVKMPPSGYMGKRELRVFLTETSARALFGENSNQFRVVAWWPTISGHQVVAG